MPMKKILTFSFEAIVWVKVISQFSLASEVCFVYGLADMLVFTDKHFNAGVYNSKYPLEFYLGITKSFLIQSYNWIPSYGRYIYSFT